MRKAFTSSALVVLSLLALAVPASAQAICWGCIPSDMLEDVYYVVRGDNVGLLTSHNIRMVRDLTGQLPRSLGADLRWGGNAYGLPIGRGFYPMYDRNMRPMGRREATITGATIGASIGYGVSGNGRGTAIGAAGGAIVGLILGHRNKGRDNGVIVTSPSQGQGVYVGPDGIPVAVGTRPNMIRQQEPVSNPPSIAGDWRVSNRTSKRAELWDGEQFIARIEPWGSVQVDAPQNGYKAVLLIPNRSGGLDQENAQIRSSENFNGWDIVAPAVQVQ